MEIKTLIVGGLETNCYWVFLPEREDGVLIDPGAEPDVIKAAVGDRKIAAILLTHGHFDHIGALAAFPDAPYYIHRNDALMLADDEWNAGASNDFSMPPLKRMPLLVHEGDTLRLAGMAIRVLHLPGHTEGSVGYAVKDVLFSGDTLFHNGYGRTDLPGGNFSELRESLRRLYQLHEDYRVYPGHGVVTVLPGRRKGSTQ